MKRALALVLLLATPVFADSDAQTRANDLFARGQGRYEAGDYRQSIALFDEAYQLVRDPVYLFNIAQSYRKLFDCEPASKYFERYLAEATDVDQSQRAKVKEILAELEPCVADRVRAKAAAPTPTPKPTPKPVVDDPGRPMRLGGLAMVGAGAIGLVVGTIYGAKGSGIKGDLADDCAAGCEWTAEREALDRDGSRANKISLVSFIAGGAVAAGGGVLYFLGRSKRNERRVAIAPLVTSGSAAVFTSFRF